MLFTSNIKCDLKSTPINPDWIIEGSPVARSCLVFTSSDRSATTMLWDCTAGQFRWEYKIDETVHILEGEVTVTVHDQVKTLRPGDLALFSAGTIAHWRVDQYVRKVAFCHRQMPAIIALPMRLVRRITARRGML